MLKKVVYQLHWLLGISAGLVLAVVGVTGGMLSFEDELLLSINRGVMTVEPRGRTPLGPPELVKRVEERTAGKRVTGFTVWAESERAVRIMLAANSGGAEGPGPRRGGIRYADPYTGELLDPPRGQDFFRQTRQMHRWLAAGDVGKHIVGASTVALIVLCLSGLYLRWPRSVRSWRAWLTFDVSRRGRSFLFGLHSVLGTWVLVPYLLMGLTGLYWSYGWYRDALFAVTGATRPVRPPAADAASAKKSRAAASGQRELSALWATARAEAGSFAMATVRLPQRQGQPLQIMYLDGGATHDRAYSRLTLDAATGTVLQHERYAEKRPGAKLMSSMFALHSGSFFGLPGLIVLMLASLLMPVFALTGWLLYLDRRRKERRGVRLRVGGALPPQPDSRASGAG